MQQRHEDLTKLMVKDLKILCKVKAIPSSGTKKNLIHRILEVEHQKQEKSCKRSLEKPQNQPVILQIEVIFQKNPDTLKKGNKNKEIEEEDTTRYEFSESFNIAQKRVRKHIAPWN